MGCGARQSLEKVSGYSSRFLQSKASKVKNRIVVGFKVVVNGAEEPGADDQRKNGKASLVRADVHSP